MQDSNSDNLKNRNQINQSDSVAPKHYFKRFESKKPPPKINYFMRGIILIGACIFLVGLYFLAVNIYENFIKDQSSSGSINNLNQANIDEQYPEISDEIKLLVTDMGFTNEAKAILYKYNPEIFESNTDSDFSCNQGIADNFRERINGCWSTSSRKIYLLRNNTLKITLVHEFLHAVYYELYIEDQEALMKVEEDIEIVFNDHREELEEIIEVYNDLLNHNDEEGFNDLNRYNELHSFIGVQIDDIPPSLESHYAKYFKNRQLLIDLHKSRL